MRTLRPQVQVVEAQELQVGPRVREEDQGMEQVVGRSVQEYLLPLHRVREVEEVVLRPPVPVVEARERQMEPRVREEGQGMVPLVGRSVQEYLLLLH